MHGISLVQRGDVIGFSGCSVKSSVIRVCTGGLWCCGGVNHVGIAVQWPGFKRPLLCESLSSHRDPCVVGGLHRCGVQLHYLRSRLVGYHGRVWHYPLRSPLTALESELLTEFTRQWLGTPYDLRGAIAARHTPLAWLFRQPENLDRFFCSEWVAACLRVKGLFDTDNASAWSPNGLLRALVRKQICARPIRLK